MRLPHWLVLGTVLVSAIGTRNEERGTRAPELVPGSSFLVPGDLTISEAKVDITPPEPLPLGGYTARQDEVMKAGGEHLFARCLYFQSSQKIALVSAEMLTIPHSLVRAVKDKIPTDVILFLCATHTHSAPDSQMLNDRMTFKIPGIATFKERWLGWYSDKIAECVNDAINKPNADLAQIDALQSNIILNRGRRPGAAPDTEATLLEEQSYLGRPHIHTHVSGPQPLLLEYAAHPVFYGEERNQTSGDWPGEVSKRFEERGKVFEVLAGALGDVSPHAPGKTPVEMIRNFSNSLLRSLRHARKEPVWNSGDPIQALEVPIKLDPPQVHPDFVKQYKLPKPIADILVKKFSPESASITALRFGSLAIIGIPGEPMSHLGSRIKKAGLTMGFKAVLVISHTNGWIGYILDPADYSHGGYEATLSFNGPQQGEHVVDAAITALKELLEPVH